MLPAKQGALSDSHKSRVKVTVLLIILTQTTFPKLLYA